MLADEEDAALLLGELGELGAGVCDDGVHRGDQVEVAAKEVGAVAGGWFGGIAAIFVWMVLRVGGAVVMAMGGDE